jgi:vanillate O-demethylase monooxygenase subunit
MEHARTPGRTLPPLTNGSPVLRRAWHAVALSHEVPLEEPVQVWVAGQPWVLARIDGQLVAFVDRCPHRLAPMSAGRIVTAEDGGGRLACGYHGWRYRTDGRCDLIPALGKSENISKRAVLRPAFGVGEAYGLVWLAPEEPLTDFPVFPEWTAEGMDRAMSRVVRTPVGAAQLVDNFLDAAHFPYVHAGTFGVDDGEPLGAGEVLVDGLQVTASFRTAYRDGGSVVEHTVTKSVGPSTVVHLRLDLSDATLGILLACLPETERSTRVFKVLTRDDLAGDAGRIEEFVKEEDQILAEDLTILERYPSPALALDPRVEVHSKVDRLSLAWRGVMAEAVRSLPEPEPAPW